MKMNSTVEAGSDFCDIVPAFCASEMKASSSSLCMGLQPIIVLDETQRYLFISIIGPVLCHSSWVFSMNSSRYL